MWPYDGFAWYCVSIDTIVQRSGCVPWESHRIDPTIDRSSDASRCHSPDVILLCGTESTGWPDL
jgi:hypothetical protein